MSRSLRELLRSVRDRRPGLGPAEAAVQATARLAEVRSAGGDLGVSREFEDALKELEATSDTVQVAVTGVGWIGGGIPSVERMLLELISGAAREIQLTAYSITSGSGRVLAALEDALATGIRCVLLVNDFDQQPASVRMTVGKLVAQFPTLAEVHDWPGGSESEGLHAKVVVADRAVALVGSANLTARGLITAHELAVVVRGPSAELIGGAIDRVVASGAVRRVQPAIRSPGSNTP